MRITGGILKGRLLKAPPGPVRPTQDKVRAALFSMLGEAALGARVLDLFAGSGALGVEAWSRGAYSVCWVESDRRGFPVLRDNVRILCTEPERPAHCVRADVFSFLARGPAGPPYTLVLADPPYDRAGGQGCLERILLALEARPVLAPGGWLVFEQSLRQAVPQRPGWILVRDRAYGETRLLIYRRAAAP